MSSDEYATQYMLIGILILGIFICAFIFAVQSAIGEVNRNTVRAQVERDEKSAKLLLMLIENYRGVKLTSIIAIISILSTLTYVVFSDYVQKLINSNFSVFNGITLAGFLVALVIVYVSIVIVIPLEFGSERADSIAIKSSRLFTLLICPFALLAVIIKLLSNTILKLLKIEPFTFKEEFSEEDVISMLEIGQDSGALKEEGKKMINSIFAFDDKLAYEIMTPRTDVFSIDILDDSDEYIDELMEMRYSRIPVYEDDSDNIIGILNIKDYLIKARERGFDAIDINEILRPAFFVPETKNIDSLFFELQKQKQHIAILIDEYGGFSGIVTMEDIIEEVMGDIDDEYDEEEEDIQNIGKNKYLLDGNMNIDYINEELSIDLRSETSETIGGFVIDILGEIPQEQEDGKIKVVHERYIFEILKVKDRRIEKLTLEIGEVKETDGAERASEEG